MSDPYGYMDTRARIAHQMGVTLAHAEGFYNDDMLRGMAESEEQSGRDVIAADLKPEGAICVECRQPSHLTDEEAELGAEALNVAAYVGKGLEGDSFCRRASATVAQFDEAMAAVSRFAYVVRERCAVTRAIHSITAGVSP